MRCHILLPGLFLLLPIFPTTVLAQVGTDVYVAALGREGGRLVVGEVANVTRRVGYDNQPSFTPDGRAVLYASIGEDGQADVFRYDRASGVAERVVRTPESEYSPAITPDGKAISVVRVEADGMQRLWRFPLDGAAPTLVLEAVAPVGYYAWGDDRVLALFVLGEPITLQLADARTGEAEVVASGIGRSLHRIPGERAISFVRKESDDAWWIERLDLDTRETRRLVRALAPSEDYAWLPDGTLLMARGSTLFHWNGTGDWEPIADLASAGVHEITRLAVSPDGRTIALVGADGGGSE